MLEHGADLGIAWDGDADRCFFIDDTGEFVPGDLITALIARLMLEQHPGATIVYDLRASWAVRDTVAAAGGTALENRVGHVFIKARLRKEDAVFAGEVSGHYYFKRLLLLRHRRSCPALVLLELVSRSGKNAVRAARRRSASGTSSRARSTPPSTTCPCSLQALKDALRPRRPTGCRTWTAISFEFDDWHFNVRPSNTEPLLRLNLEALSEADDGVAPGRGARADPVVTPSPTAARRFDSRSSPASGFDETDAQGVVYYGRYMPYFDRARVEYLRHLGLLAARPRS